MYLRETRRKNKDGSVVSYLQLAHNERHQATGSPVARVIHNFGRADQVDRTGLARLVSSISRFLEPTATLKVSPAGEIEVVDSRRFGGAYVLDRLWERLGIGSAIRRTAEGRRLDADATERVLFALVANRCLEPTSKLAAVRWATERVAVPGCPTFDDDAAYAAMDFLLEALGEIASQVFSSTANLLNLACDLVFVDTSSTYFCRDMADGLADIDRKEGEVQDDTARQGEEAPEESAVRRFSKHSKDHRTDRPQVVLAMAVTKEGIPIRCWTFPGTTSDQVAIRRVKEDLAGWQLHRVLWVTDSGFNSAANRALLQTGGGHFVVAERIRSAAKDVRATVARAGRYQVVAGNLEVKEVKVGDGARAQRFVVCMNPEVAARDQTVRANLVAYLEERIEGTDTWSKQRRDELVGELRTTPGVYRLLRRTKDGKLRVDKAKVANEARYDGKFVLRSSDDSLSAADIALAYKQLHQVERGWRDMKGSLELRPVFHHREDRIRAHVQLCWLALLLIRTVEHTTAGTWRNVRNELERMHLVTLATDEGRVTQRSATTPRQREILSLLEVAEPPRFVDFELPPPAA